MALLEEKSSIKISDGYISNAVSNSPLSGGLLLPVELTSFSAVAENQNVVLAWQTATEIDNYGFKVERHILKQVQYDGTFGLNLSRS